MAFGLIAELFQTEVRGFLNPQQQIVDRFSLAVTALQFRNRADIEIIIFLDNDVKLTALVLCYGLFRSLSVVFALPIVFVIYNG